MPKENGIKHNNMNFNVLPPAIDGGNTDDCPENLDNHYLRERDFAWIVFGVDNKTHEITGTSFKDGEAALNKLKQDMSQHTTDKLIFREIVPIYVDGKRVLMFKIPASPRNIVMCRKGIAYGRDGESLVPLNQAKRDEIRNQPPVPDWTAQLVPNATIDDLDELAIATARIMYKKVHASNIPAEEVNGWTTEEFLSNSNMMRDGQITRAAILLLGKPSALDKIHPAVAQITWTLEDEEEIVQDYEHFGWWPSSKALFVSFIFVLKLQRYRLFKFPPNLLLFFCN